jgi:pantothenate kinase type III
MGTNESMNIRWLSHWRQNSDVAPMVLGKDCRVPIEKRCGSGTGNDRMVHALGAKAQYPNQRVLVVSAGSALVVDLVVSGVLMGGLIGLGWNRYQKAMKSLNANLSTTELDVSYPGLETPEAVSLGWKLSVKTLIDQLLSCEKVDQMLITGGDAGLLKKEYPEAEVNPFLGIDALAQAFGYA